MHESSTYQQLMNEGVRKGRQEGLQEGLVKGKRDAIVKVGQKNLGPVSKSIQKSLDAIVDPIRLDLLLDQVSSVQSWNELLRVGTSGK